VIDIESAVLPLSQVHLQWRPADRSWRVLDVAQAAADDPASVAVYDEMWSTWSGKGSSLIRADGDVWTRPSWIACYGQRPAGGRVTITLADGHRPAVVVVGQVWGAEWSGLAQPITVQYDDEAPSTSPMRRPRHFD
jgi:hypothetical protein